MEFIGESIALFVSVTWTATALFSEVASKRFGAIQLNVIRMALSLVFLSLTLLAFTGSAIPKYADVDTWFWLSMSGLVGYVFGDYCLFNAYIVIGSRFGQLFMTLAPLAAAISGWAILDERMMPMAIVGMFVTIIGIGFSVLGKGDNGEKVKLKLPLKGVLLGVGAGIGQGVGLVLSKIGMEHYAINVPDATANADMMLPFASTMIRAITGLIFFTLILVRNGDFADLKRCVTDKIGMRSALGATITGPFIGVSLSLMAVRYTESGVAQTLMALTPVLILLPAYLIFRQKVTLKEVIGAMISVIGVSLFFI